MNNLEKLKELAFQICNISMDDELRNIKPEEVYCEISENEGVGYIFTLIKPSSVEPINVFIDVHILENELEIRISEQSVGDINSADYVYFPNEKKVYESLNHKHDSHEGDIEIQDDAAAVSLIKDMISSTFAILE